MVIPARIRVSVLIDTYNHERFIERAVSRSVLDQGSPTEMKSFSIGSIRTAKECYLTTDLYGEDSPTKSVPVPAQVKKLTCIC